MVRILRHCTAPAPCVACAPTAIGHTSYTSLHACAWDQCARVNSRSWVGLAAVCNPVPLRQIWGTLTPAAIVCTGMRVLVPDPGLLHVYSSSVAITVTPELFMIQVWRSHVIVMPQAAPNAVPHTVKVVLIHSTPVRSWPSSDLP